MQWGYFERKSEYSKITLEQYLPTPHDRGEIAPTTAHILLGLAFKECKI
jgi:hypothetical protein